MTQFDRSLAKQSKLHGFCDSDPVFLVFAGLIKTVSHDLTYDYIMGRSSSVDPPPTGTYAGK